VPSLKETAEMPITPVASCVYFENGDAILKTTRYLSLECCDLTRLHLLCKLRIVSVESSPTARMRVVFEIFESVHSINKRPSRVGQAFVWS